MSNPEGFPLEEQPQKSEVEIEREGFKQIQGFVTGINKLFGKKYNLSVPQENLPLVVKGPGPAYGEGYENLDGEKKNLIRVKDVNQIAEGSALGEEMSHFYRSQFRKDHKEINTDEFFGWLGRKLLFRATQKKDGASDFFPEGEPKLDKGIKREVIERTKETKGKLRDITKGFIEGDLTIQEAIEQRTPLAESRKRDTHHFRGYEFASKVDLNKITDWKKIYSMSDKEVRKRFFTPNPDYSDL